MNTFSRLILVASLSVLVTACVSNRTVAIMPEQKAAVQQVALTKTAAIQVVSDQRTFEDRPRQANIPSLKGGQAASATMELKARAIARKRSAYGRAKGDVVLPEGQTVAALVQTRVSNALQRAGYKVVDATDSNADLTLSVNINKMWMWFRPGAFTVSVNSEIETTITSNVSPAMVIDNKYSVSKALVVNTLWAEVLNESLNQYEDKLTSQLKQLD